MEVGPSASTRTVEQGGDGVPLGVLVPPTLEPARFPAFVRHVEAAGFEEIWIPEDCFLSGAVAQAATALALTSLRVGIGIMPAAARNVAFAAMELAFLASAHPGRLTVGVGHGMRGWLEQAGVAPASPLTLLEEYLVALRRLLAGDTVSVAGTYVRLDGVRLDHPPSVVPGVLAGVRGPRSLALAGRVADGTILAEPVAPEYLTVARSRIAAGGTPGRIVGYNVAAVADDPAAARAAVRPALVWAGQAAWTPHFEPLPFADDLADLQRRVPDPRALVQQLPDEWVDTLALVGTAEQVRVRVAELYEAGASTVVMTPVGPDPDAAVSALATVLH